MINFRAVMLTAVGAVLLAAGPVGAFGEASAATGIGGNQNDNSALQAGAAYVFQ